MSIKKIKKSEKIFFLFNGEIFEEKINDRYYMIDRLYIETDSFNVHIDKQLINQSQSIVYFEKLIISSNREELENVKAI